MEQLSQTFSNYYEYFEHLRKKLYFLAVTFFVFFVVGFFEAGVIIKFIIGIFNLKDALIVTTSPFQFLDLSTKIGFYTGLIVCVPLFIYYLYDFLKDGLNKKEKNLFFVLLPTGMFLFVCGFLYCFTILYFYLNSISTINLAFDIKNVWDISSFLSQIIFASICFGFVFQFPIILTFLIRVGLLDLNFLIEKRIFAISAIFIFVGFLPPPDIFSTILQALPLAGLYQLTLWVNSAINKVYSVETRQKKVETLVIESAVYE